MISRIVSSIAVLLVVLVSSAAAFSTQQHSSIGKTRQSQLQTPTICFAEVDESNSDDATNDEPKVAVKCPGCDLCDGSGRCVSYLTVHNMLRFANYMLIIFFLIPNSLGYFI